MRYFLSENSNEKFTSSNGKQYDNYDEYLYSISNYLPKKLLKYYDESYSGHKNNRFHDCLVKKIEFSSNSYIYKNLNDSIKLTLNLGNEIEYILNFQEIKTIDIKFLNYKNVDLSNHYGYNGYNDFVGCFGEIIDCKLGLTNENNYLIEFNTSVGFEFSIAFHKISIKKLKLI